MRRGLLLKLLAVNIPVVAMVILVLWLMLDTLAANYFALLMKEYRINPTDAHQMFVHSVHRYLIWTSAGALGLGGLLSFLLTRMVLGPLYQMTASARLISGGDYSSRVPAGGQRDEIGELARAFNQMAASIQRVEQLRRDLVANVAHEFRTPLTNIRGYLEALEDGVVSPLPETFELLLEETLRLTRLVENLLDLARADAAKTSLELETIDLSELAGRVLKQFAPGFRQKDILVASQLGVAATVSADREKLRAVMENLVKNALHYTPEKGAVAVRTEKIARGVRFCIENSGPGILPGDLPFIFERFYRGEKSRSREYGGTGIGLAIVKEIVAAHGGEASVESTPGKTVFCFTLPDFSEG